MNAAHMASKAAKAEKRAAATAVAAREVNEKLDGLSSELIEEFLRKYPSEQFFIDETIFPVTKAPMWVVREWVYTQHPAEYDARLRQRRQEIFEIAEAKHGVFLKEERSWYFDG